VITVMQYRNRSGEHFDQPTLTFENSFEALSHMVRSELRHGGKITALKEDRIKVDTDIWGTLDTSIFEGSVEEMHSLVQFSAYYVQGRENSRDLIADQFVSDFDKIGGFYAGTPLLLSLAAPFLMGSNCLKVAFMLACGVLDKDELRVGTAVSLDHLFAALSLYREGACSFREAFYL